MQLEAFSCIFSTVVFFTYGTICTVTILFTFFPEAYQVVDELVKMNIVASRILTPLEANIDSFDIWLMKHNRTIGPFLIILSLVDMELFFNIINKL
ncbi:MAG TPA: hypothetical protein VMD52_02465 [Patescibacteria group bacterium]|nr:hypothetical protein [Patescibacteria group bacterium]